MIKILFICMGNICRSPAAEAIMQAFINKERLAESIWLDSCATHGYHVGHHADARMIEYAKRRGYALTSIARQFNYPDDFIDYDYILVMDENNEHHIRSLDSNRQYQHKIHKMTDFCRNIAIADVPDPYYGGATGFEHVLDILEDACTGLLNDVRQRLKNPHP